MRVAVIGAGIFGLTAAVILRRSGHEVTVFERERHPMMAASLVNQGRLHRGYHYPRAADTIQECIAAEASFRRMYGEAVIDGEEDYYCIARDGSKVSADRYRAVLDAHGLPYREEPCPLVAPYAVQACFRVSEGNIDPFRLNAVVARNVREAGVRIRCGVAVPADVLQDSFDFVVVAAYASLNEALGTAAAPQEYQYEVVEKPIVSLPSAFGNRHTVIMDGPFMCVDPFGTTGLYLLGNVTYAIHATNTGVRPEVPDLLRPLLNRGPVAAPPVTNFPAFVRDGVRFMPMLAGAQHVGSLYAIRAVLPRRDATDERPTIVRRVADRVCTIFAGKFSSCVQAAEDVAAMLGRSDADAGKHPVDLQRDLVARGQAAAAGLDE